MSQSVFIKQRNIKDSNLIYPSSLAKTFRHILLRIPSTKSQCSDHWHFRPTVQEDKAPKTVSIYANLAIVVRSRKLPAQSRYVFLLRILVTHTCQSLFIEDTHQL